jgi:hypothetical protein
MSYTSEEKREMSFLRGRIKRTKERIKEHQEDIQVYQDAIKANPDDAEDVAICQDMIEINKDFVRIYKEELIGYIRRLKNLQGIATYEQSIYIGGYDAVSRMFDHKFPDIIHCHKF